MQQAVAGQKQQFVLQAVAVLCGLMGGRLHGDHDVPQLQGARDGHGRQVVETRILEYHGERRGDLYYTKPMLLAVGDRYEDVIAALDACAMANLSKSRPLASSPMVSSFLR